jgi:hypothetical protein
MVTTIYPSVFLSKCESRLRDERASKDPENVYFTMLRRFAENVLGFAILSATS